MASLTTVARISAPIRVASRASSETTNSVRAPAASRSNTVATPRQLVRVHTPHARRGERLVANGRKGMLAETLDGEEGGAKKSKNDKKAGKFAQTQSMAASVDPKAAKRKDGYIAVGNVNTDFTEKNIKLLELANQGVLDDPELSTPESLDAACAKATKSSRLPRVFPQRFR